MARKSSRVVQYKIRVREALRRRIEKAAEKNGVSANHEMVSRLERSFDQEAVQSINQVATNLEAASTRLVALFEPGANTPLTLLAEAAVKRERETKETEQSAAPPLPPPPEQKRTASEPPPQQKRTASGDDQ
jgi:predicted NBD/HSP70 family sugar kinase